MHERWAGHGECMEIREIHTKLPRMNPLERSRHVSEAGLKGITCEYCRVI
jgi:hypothetical protein